MTALDVSHLVTETDESAELTEFKNKLVKVAKAYKNRYGWCNEVDRALKELGVEPPKTVTVILQHETFPGINMNVQVIANKLHRKSEDEQKKTLVKELGKVQMTVKAGGRTVNTEGSYLDASGVVKMELWAPAVGPLAAPAGYYWRYSGPDGQVLHLYSATEEDFSRGQSRYAECGQWTPDISAAPLETRRGKGQACKTCVKSPFLR